MGIVANIKPIIRRCAAIPSIVMGWVWVEAKFMWCTIKPTSTCLMVGTIILSLVAAAFYIATYKENASESENGVVVVRASHAAPPTRSSVPLVHTVKVADLAGSLQSQFPFVKKGSTSCNEDACVIAGVIDMAKEANTGQIKNFIDAELRDYVSNNGYVPLSDADLLVLSEDDIRFSLKYRTAIKH